MLISWNSDVNGKIKVSISVWKILELTQTLELTSSTQSN